MLSPKKVDDFDNTKLLPSLNFMCILNIKSWGDLREIFCDYGKKYSLRNSVNISIYIAVYLSIMIILVL